jgi:hypothetical protein
MNTQRINLHVRDREKICGVYRLARVLDSQTEKPIYIHYGGLGHKYSR